MSSSPEVRKKSPPNGLSLELPKAFGLDWRPKAGGGADEPDKVKVYHWIHNSSAHTKPYLIKTLSGIE